MTVFDVSIYEPIHPGWTADSIAVTADSTIYTADGGPLEGATEATDAGVNAHIYDVDIIEPVASVWTADSTAVTADSTYWTADGGPLVGARDTTDAEVISAELPISEVGGVARPLKPFPVIGRGYGILPELEGEAIGIVGVIGKGQGKASELAGAAEGTVGAVGRSHGQLLVHAHALGNRGQAGAAVAVIKGLSIAAKGASVTRGWGTTTIALKGRAVGRHDDDEIAAVTLLLAA